MTIARYCGGLFVALSLAAMGVAVGCTQQVDDTDIDGGVEEAVAEGEMALSADVAATGTTSDGSWQCDDKGCALWEAEAEIDDDEQWVFIEVDNGCEVFGAEIDGDFYHCRDNGPRCHESGFKDPDCILKLDNHRKSKKVVSDGTWDDDDEEIRVLIGLCDNDSYKPKVKIAQGPGANCEEIDDDVDVQCEGLRRKYH